MLGKDRNAGMKNLRVWFLPRRVVYGGVFAVILLLAAAFAVQSQQGTAEMPSVSVTADAENEPVFQGVTGGPNVAITVNVDWGEEWIPEILRILAEHDVKVTFFVTGVWAEKNPELLKQMAEAGHSIQSHGYRHDHYNQMSVEQAVAEIKKAEKVISAITGKKCAAFASPYGEFDETVQEAALQANVRLIMWTVDSIDWQKPDPETIAERILSKAGNDSILLFHPVEPTVKALPRVLEGLREKGLQCRTIEEILQPSVVR